MEMLLKPDVHKAVGTQETQKLARNLEAFPPPHPHLGPLFSGQVWAETSIPVQSEVLAEETVQRRAAVVPGTSNLKAQSHGEGQANG